MPPGMSPEFRARQFTYSPPRQITGTVEPPIEAQARDVTPAKPRTQRDGRRYAYCVSLAFPVCFAVWSIVIGDMRVAMILLLMTLFMAVVGLFTLDGPP